MKEGFQPTTIGEIGILTLGKVELFIDLISFIDF
jgi:hypothetical protein